MEFEVEQEVKTTQRFHIEFDLKEFKSWMQENDYSLDPNDPYKIDYFIREYLETQVLYNYNPYSEETVTSDVIGYGSVINYEINDEFETMELLTNVLNNA